MSKVIEQVKGKAEVVAGVAEQSLGKILGNQETQTDGAAKELVGEAREAVAAFVEQVKRAPEQIKEAAERLQVVAKTKLHLVSGKD